ncbi:RTA1 like protein-domain-containing protein [Flagelloscypha sp. PMI_526]|nr:RTA1 like protein-domain-containing protein [Flagelloscypha sp. PMI_526]
MASESYDPLFLDSSPPTSYSPYGYIPTVWVCYIFIILFGVSGAFHLFQAIRFRAYWIIPTAVLCAIGEVLGWSGRLWSHFDPTNDTPFMMQLTTTVLAPTPLLAVNFIVFGRMVYLMGEKYSLLSSRWIGIMFISADVIALAIQGTGGGIASGEKHRLGSRIILAGIAFQFAVMIIASLFAIHFVVNWHLHRSTLNCRDLPSHILLSPMDSSRDRITETSTFHLSSSRLTILICGISFNSLCLIIRAIYRLIELNDGWQGNIVRTQLWFNIFDGTMVLLAIVTLNAASPAWIFFPLSGGKLSASEIHSHS